jgi:RimJ/RimL family protein N-acetyltransferase
MGRKVKIQLRRATPEDAAALAAVEVRSWRAAYRGLMPDAYLDGLSEAEKTVAWRQNMLKHGPSGRKRVCVALSAAGISGFVRVGPVMDAGEVGLIYLLYVLPEHWGRGVGTALMHVGMQELRDLGMRDATLWVLRDNLRACRFYEHLGWTFDGRTVSEDYGGCRLEALCYRRLMDASGACSALLTSVLLPIEIMQTMR